jgi:hypothetical protein
MGRVAIRVAIQEMGHDPCSNGTTPSTPSRLFDIARHGAVHVYGVQAADGTIDAEPVAIVIACDGQALDVPDVATARALWRDLGEVLRGVSRFDALHDELAATQG